MIRDDLALAVRRVLADAGLPEPPGGVKIDLPKQRDHGDWATPVALALAKAVGAQAARDRRARWPPRSRRRSVPHLERVEVAPPGLRQPLPRAHLAARRAARRSSPPATRYGTADALAGQRINLEFVSANPTGPLHAGGGRWVAVGDAIANLLAAQGAEVHREYYLNDAGNQLDTFRDSLYARYRGRAAARGRLPGRVPRRDGRAAARRARRRRVARGRVRVGRATQSSRASATTSAASACTSTRGSRSARCTSAARSPTCSRDARRARRRVRRTTARRWLRSTDFGDPRDRVLVRVRRHDDVPLQRPRVPPRQVRPRLEPPHRHLGRRPPRSGEVAAGRAWRRSASPAGRARGPARPAREAPARRRARSGCRSAPGNIVTLADILDEVDPDVARLTFLLQGIDTPQTFDLDVVTPQSMENPVYYVQYAHARVVVDRDAGRRGGRRRARRSTTSTSRCSSTSASSSCCALLAAYPDVGRRGGRDCARRRRSPPGCATSPRAFHGFYRDCRVISDDADAHPGAAVAGRGVPDRARERARRSSACSAPDEMTRLDDDDDDGRR